MDLGLSGAKAIVTGGSKGMGNRGLLGLVQALIKERERLCRCQVGNRFAKQQAAQFRQPIAFGKVRGQQRRLFALSGDLITCQVKTESGERIVTVGPGG